MDGSRARVDEVGRLMLPDEIRSAVGLERGGDVVLELAGNEIRIRTADDDVVSRAQRLTRRLLAGKTGTTVDDFLAERGREAGEG